jgi:hypothetical protein
LPIANIQGHASSFGGGRLLGLRRCGCGLRFGVRRGTSPGDRGASGSYFGGHPGQQATRLRIDGADCAALATAVEARTGRRLRRESDRTPPNSHCQLQGRGVHVSISLDTAYAARQRYSNRIDEQVQFNAADPAKVPHSVPNVGDKAAYDHNASWIPAYSTLWAVRGNRWLTVIYSVAGETRAQRLAAAAPLARRAFRLTAR